jgi:hypothetical protein
MLPGRRSDKECEVYWVEAQDGGDPRVEVSPRDIVYTLSAEDPLADPQQVLPCTRQHQALGTTATY